MGKAFITVGTTSFDTLLHTLLTEDILRLFVDYGFTDLKIQHGRTSMTGLLQARKLAETVGIDLTLFDYKNSLNQDMKHADLIISHAGSGSILEALSLKKKLVVVVNQELLHNHQLELAQELGDKNYLFYTTCQELKSILEKALSRQQIEFPQPDSASFIRVIDSEMGYSEL